MFGALFTTWSKATKEKLKVMNSMIGRSPTMAAPTPMPANPFSLIGVSMIRLGPETFEQTLAHFVGAVVFGDFFSHQKDIRIALQLFRERFVQRLTISDFSHALRAAPLT